MSSKLSFRGAALRSPLLALLALAACGDGGGDCEDGTDNDGDGRIDVDDPACAAGQDAEAPDPVAALCDDGLDNDGDALLDADDPGCANPGDNDESNEPIAACRDGIDNDADGLIDYPNDPGCALGSSDAETDDCPDGPGCPACANGLDDDGDGAIDYGEGGDGGCDNAADNEETQASNGACGAVPIELLPDTGDATGTIAGGVTGAMMSSTCGGTGSEVIYQFTTTGPRSAVFTTDFPETTLDTVLYLRSDCLMGESEVTCNDDASSSSFGSTLVVSDLPAGTYYLVVDTSAHVAPGDFKLEVTLQTAVAASCDASLDECPSGYHCQHLTVDAAGDTCELPRCADTLDFDGDGRPGFPSDPGCTSTTDNDEVDDCPSGPGCSPCSNGVDDDGDGTADFPADVTCANAAFAVEGASCAVEAGPIGVIAGGATSGTTVGQGSDLESSCNSSGGGDGNEAVYALQVPGRLVSLTLDTSGSTLTDTTVYVRAAADCTGADLGCDDDGGTGYQSLLTMSNVAPGLYLVMVAAYSSSIDGAFVLNTSGVIATGEGCSEAAQAGGLFTCQGGGACTAGVCAAP